MALSLLDLMWHKRKPGIEAGGLPFGEGPLGGRVEQLPPFGNSRYDAVTPGLKYESRGDCYAQWEASIIVGVMLIRDGEVSVAVM